MQEEKLKISNSRLSNIFFLSLPLSFLYYLYSQPVRARFYVPILRLLLFPFILSFSFSNCTLLRWIFRRPPLASLEQNPSSVVVPYPLQDPTIPCIPIAFPEPLPTYLPTYTTILPPVCLRWTLATVVLLFRINIRRFPRPRIYLTDVQISRVSLALYDTTRTPYLEIANFS